MYRSVTVAALAGLIVLAAGFVMDGYGSALAQAPMAAASSPSGGKPKIQIDEPKHDFGKVWLDDKLEHNFTIRNTGSADLHILKVSPLCWCVTVSEYPKVIPPGGSGRLTARLDVRQRKGNVTTGLEVVTDEPSSKPATILLTAYVRHYVDVEPISVYFEKLKPQASAERTVVLTNNTDKPIKLTVKQPTHGSPVFTWEMKEMTPGKKYELRVKASPPYASKYTRQVLEIETGVPDIATLKLTCTAACPERLDVEPDPLWVPLNPQVTRRQVRFLVNDDKPVKVLQATVSDPAVKVTVSPTKQGEEYLLTLALPARYVPPRDGAELIIKTDDAEQPEIRVPIRSPLVPTSRPAIAQSQPYRPAMQLLGQAAPQASATTFDGKPLKIGGKSDKVQMLVFYASWCPYCKRALPYIQDMHKQYKDKPVEIIAVNQDSPTDRHPLTEQQTLATYKGLNLSMPMTMDSKHEIAARFKVSTYPTVVLISTSGIVEAVHFGVGAAADSTFPRELDVLLQGKTRAAFPTPPPSPVVQQPSVPNPLSTRPVTTPPRPPTRPVMTMAGKEAPAATVKTFDGKDLKIGAGAGRVQLLAFYASWCGYCKRAMPAVEQLNRDLMDKGVDVIAINQDSPTARAPRTREQTLVTYKEWNLSMPMTLDPEQKIARSYLVTGFPTFFVIGQSGLIEAVHVGYTPALDNTARRELDLLLQGKSRADFPGATAMAPASRPAS